MKLIVCFLLSINILIANQPNVVKTSELELFLFKIGFESLLTDVDITKNKSNLNESELIKLNSKIEIIMGELYKDKRVLTNDSEISKTTDISYKIDKNIKKEISTLKDEVSLLKNQINKLLLNKKEKENAKENTKKVSSATRQYKIKANSVNVRENPFPSAKIVQVLEKGTLVSIEYCNKYSWCKFKDEEKFISRLLLKRL